MTVAYTLSNAWGVSAPATVTFTVVARPDPTQDPEVSGLLNAQAQSAQQLAQSQIRNFNDGSSACTAARAAATAPPT